MRQMIQVTPQTWIGIDLLWKVEMLGPNDPDNPPVVNVHFGLPTTVVTVAREYVPAFLRATGIWSR